MKQTNTAFPWFSGKTGAPPQEQPCCRIRETRASFKYRNLAASAQTTDISRSKGPKDELYAERI